MRVFPVTMTRIVMLTIFAMSILAAPAKADPSDETKLQLKAAVLDHIEKSTNDGVYYFIDHESTDLRELSFVAMHPVIFERADGTYALCADFIDTAGEKVLVDYYLRDVAGGLVVLSSVEGRRSILMQIAEKFDL